MSEESDIGTDDITVETTESSSSFRDGISHEFRDDPSISKFDNVNDLVKEHVNLQSLLGRKGTITPNENDSPDIWNKYRSENNIPESFDKYNLETFNKPEDDWDDDFQSRMAEVSHKLNLSNDQFSELLNGYVNYINDASEASQKDIEFSSKEAIDGLKKEWGRAYEAKTNIGASALNQLTKGDPSSIATIELSDGSLLGNNPNFIRIMASMGESLQEKGLIEGVVVNNSAMSPEEARSKLNMLMGDQEKSNILFSTEYNPAKEELVKERDRLLSFAYPQE